MVTAIISPVLFSFSIRISNIGTAEGEAIRAKSIAEGEAKKAILIAEAEGLEKKAEAMKKFTESIRSGNAEDIKRLEESIKEIN